VRAARPHDALREMSAPPRRLPVDYPWHAALRRLARARSVIVCHHGVGTLPVAHDPLFLQVPPARLRRQLELLEGSGFQFRTVADLVAEADGGPLPPGRVALTFDDGMGDNHATALPLLRELGVPATFYVATGLAGLPNPWLAPESGERMMDAAELRALVDAGMELGAHTVTHPDLSQLSYAACIEEIGRGRDELEAMTGVRATTFAYPFGAYGQAGRRAAEDVGFDAAVTANGHGDWGDRHALPRSLLWGRDQVPSFVAKLTGAFDPVFHHPTVRVARDHTRGLRHRGRALLTRHG
jgi:peptidoglycan/xylan/chitin deacetylase (PgdA/CDA1 family)